MQKQGWMLKTSPSFQRMENGDLPAKVRKYDQASHNVWLKAYPIHQYTNESELLLWTSSNVDGCKNHWPGSTNTTLFSVSEPTITNLPLMRKTSAKSVTTPSFRVTFGSTLCVDNVSLLRNGYANSRKPSKQSWLREGEYKSMPAWDKIPKISKYKIPEVAQYLRDLITEIVL